MSTLPPLHTMPIVSPSAGLVRAAEYGGQCGGAAAFEGDAQFVPRGALGVTDGLVVDLDPADLVAAGGVEADLPDSDGAEAVDGSAGHVDNDAFTGIQGRAEATSSGWFDPDDPGSPAC